MCAPAAEASGPLPSMTPSPRPAARPFARLLPALLAMLLLLAPLAADPLGRAAMAATAPIAPLPEASAPRPKVASEVPDSGSFHRAKVRILGIPVITVASRVVSDSGGPTARQRAQVIEGNLEQLYRSQQVCTGSESIGERIVEALAPHPNQRELACDSNQLGLLGQPEALTVEVVSDGDGPPVLRARVPGRELPLPLLSVTDDDARLNGTSAERLAQRWQTLLQRRLRLARHLLEPSVLSQRLRTLALLQLALVGLLVGGLLLWRGVRRRLERLEERLASGTPVEQPAVRWRHPLTVGSLHLLSRGLLAAAVLLAPLMAGVVVLAMPGQIPLAIDLLVQPFGILAKLLVGWLLAQQSPAVAGQSPAFRSALPQPAARIPTVGVPGLHRAGGALDADRDPRGERSLQSRPAGQRRPARRPHPGFPGHAARFRLGSHGAPRRPLRHRRSGDHRRSHRRCGGCGLAEHRAARRRSARDGDPQQPVPAGDQRHQVPLRLRPSSPPIPPGAPIFWRTPSYWGCGRFPPRGWRWR